MLAHEEIQRLYKRDVQTALQSMARLSPDLTYDLFQRYVLDANERELIASKQRLQKVVILCER